MIQNYDPIGNAIFNYFNNHDNTPIVVKSSMIEDEDLPPEYFFRDFSDFPLLEKVALKNSTGSILDVGACAGCHSIYLQEKGLKVCALDISELCCKVMRQRGIKNVINSNIFEYSGETYDTILLLMNGVGIAGDAEGLLKLLLKLKLLLNTNGKILLDSSDLVYLYEQADGSVVLDLNSKSYYGEVDYQLEYRNNAGKSFNWLFADQGLLSDVAELAGLKTKIIEYGPHYDYLAELSNT